MLSETTFDPVRFRFDGLVVVAVRGVIVLVVGDDDAATALSLSWNFVRTGDGGGDDSSLISFDDFPAVDLVFVLVGVFRGFLDGVTGAETNSSSDISEPSSSSASKTSLVPLLALLSFFADPFSPFPLYTFPVFRLVDPVGVPMTISSTTTGSSSLSKENGSGFRLRRLLGDSDDDEMLLFRLFFPLTCISSVVVLAAEVRRLDTI
jgi:hypothetical protein